MFKPLDGVRVIDITQILAGPFCSYQLALMGAEVIKIEPPDGGDWARGLGSDGARNAARMGLGYLTQNAAKRSITINLKAPRGVEIVRRLAKDADVLIENMRPHVLERLGLGYAGLKAENPRLVYASISGFGQEGPLSPRPAYDHIIQGMSGFMSLIGREGEPPLKVGAPFIDYAAGVNAALAVVAALHQVRRTGQGLHLDVAMLDSALQLLSSVVVEYVNAGTIPRRIGNDATSGVATAGPFTARDGLLLIAANAPAHFAPLAEAIGRPDLVTDARFRSAADRQANRDLLRAEINRTLAARTAAEWETILEAAGVPAARPRSLPEVVDDPHVRARGLVGWTQSGDGGRRVGVPGLGFLVDGAATTPTTPPPRLGADTEAVLRQAGFTDDEIAALRADGVV